MLLLALIGGLVTGAVTGNKNAGLAVGGGVALIALLALYMQGKEERAKVESELAQLPPEEQAYWKPALDTPEIIPIKLRERLTA